MFPDCGNIGVEGSVNVTRKGKRMSLSNNPYVKHQLDAIKNPMEKAVEELGTLGDIISTSGNILALKSNYVNNNFCVEVNLPSGIQKVYCEVQDNDHLTYNNKTFKEFKGYSLSDDQAKYYNAKMQERKRIERAFKIARFLNGDIFSLVIPSAIAFAFFGTSFALMSINPILSPVLMVIAWTIIIFSFCGLDSDAIAVRVSGLKRRHKKWNDTVTSVPPALAYGVSERVLQYAPQRFAHVNSLCWQSIEPVNLNKNSLTGGNGIYIQGADEERGEVSHILYQASDFKEL